MWERRRGSSPDVPSARQPKGLWSSHPQSHWPWQGQLPHQHLLLPRTQSLWPARRNVADISQAHLGPGYLMGQGHARVRKRGRPSGENSGVGAEALISLQSGGAPGEEPAEQRWGWVAALATGGPMMSRGVPREVQGVPGKGLGLPGAWPSGRWGGLLGGTTLDTFWRRIPRAESG